MFEFLAPGVQGWFWSGLVVSFLAGFFATSRGRLFQRPPGRMILTLLFVGLGGILVFIALNASPLAILIPVVVYWICLGLGGLLMARNIGY
jgi:hypothetical protein